MSMNCTVDPCEDVGLLLPIFYEGMWPQGFRAFVYCLALLWCFLGVAIIADVFMCSIEKITSKTRVIRIADPDEEDGTAEIEVKVWNDTVANLTLMALGSSAPEILLNVVEIVGNTFVAGELGPSTIVGSASFNLLVITAVCVISIPSPDIRTIKYIKVFGVTAFFAVASYIWLIIILVLISPDYVELWEAVVTFLFFPIMVILAYIADRDFCSKRKVADPKIEMGFDDPKTGRTRTDTKMMRDFIKDLSKVHPNLSEEEIAQLAAAKISEEQTHNHLWYRINATRKIGGGHKLNPTLSEELNEVHEHLKAREEDDGFADQNGHLKEYGSQLDIAGHSKDKSIIEFTATRCAILEKEGRVSVAIRRYGKSNNRVIFKIETIDGTAEANSDYIPVKTTMTFEDGETYKTLDILIIDDNEWEPDEVFFVKLSLDPEEPSTEHAQLGKKTIQEITILNDDEPGTFEFSKPSLLFKESTGKALIPVERKNGADGKVTITWKTEDMSAVSGKDYEGGEGTLVFEHGELTKTIEIPIHDDQEIEKDECFKIDLLSISEGAKLGRVKKTVVTIINDDDFNGMISRLVVMTNTNMDNLRIESTSYTQQFHNAMNVNGGDLDGATHMDYVMHFMTFAWKILFAVVPPVSMAGGWISFVLALAMIGLLTAVVGDLAMIFGCLIGLRNSVTAITFVALGTSLPDLFASKQAATQEKTADNSIGNVTGSNAVNVFLGLGMPWLFASIYWTIQGKTFYVKAGSLSFSVIIYCLCACVCLGTLMLRRYLGVFGKGELGGTKIPKIVCGVIFCSLWMFYVLICAFEAYDYFSVNL